MSPKPVPGTTKRGKVSLFPIRSLRGQLRQKERGAWPLIKDPAAEIPLPGRLESWKSEITQPKTETVRWGQRTKCRWARPGFSEDGVQWGRCVMTALSTHPQGRFLRLPPKALEGWQPLQQLLSHTNKAEPQGPLTSSASDARRKMRPRLWVLDTAFQVRSGDHVHGRPRQESCWEFKATLGYMSSRSAWVGVRYVENKTKNI